MGKGNIPASQRIPEDDAVAVILWARENGQGAIRSLMEMFNINESKATYQYLKLIKKGKVRHLRNEHYPREAIMFLNSAREERITLCQVCKVVWPCSHEVLRLQTVADPSQRQVS